MDFFLRIAIFLTTSQKKRVVGLFEDYRTDGTDEENDVDCAFEEEEDNEKEEESEENEDESEEKRNSALKQNQIQT